MKSEEDRSTEEDKAFLSGAGAVLMTLELLKEVTEGLQKNAETFEQIAVKLISNVEEATRIKSYRCHNNTCAGTWRYVAACAHAHYHSKAYEYIDWYPASNQLMGMALCANAAKVLGEDPDKEPWN